MIMPMAQYDALRATQDALGGAITAGITPEPDGRTTPATSTLSAGAALSRGSLLSRAAALSQFRRAPKGR